MSKLSKHDKLIKMLERRLKQTHLEDIIKANEEYDYKHRHGEIDLYLVHRGINEYIYVFEMKTNDKCKNKRKAKYQLERAEAYLKHYYDIERVFKFYVHYDPEELYVVEWIK